MKLFIMLGVLVLSLLRCVAIQMRDSQYAPLDSLADWTVWPTALPTVTPTASPTASATILLQIVFEGDYETVIGNNKASFLQECSAKLAPVTCFDVHPGSIVVDVQGSANDISAAIEQSRLGLELPGFGSLALVTSSPTMSPTDSCGTCVIWGDPHVLTFEAHKKRLAEHPRQEEFFRTRGWKSDQLTINGDGVYCLVRNEQVHIQGSYAYNETSKTTTLRELAVSGPFLKEKVLHIPPLSGQVMWGGEEILASIGSEFQDGVVSASYSKASKMVKDGTLGPGIEMVLPQGVALTVNRWSNSLAVEIRMCPAIAVEGQCSNSELQDFVP